jgi:hypothetical protein
LVLDFHHNKIVPTLKETKCDGRIGWRLLIDGQVLKERQIETSIRVELRVSIVTLFEVSKAISIG